MSICLFVPTLLTPSSIRPFVHLSIRYSTFSFRPSFQTFVEFTCRPITTTTRRSIVFHVDQPYLWSIRWTYLWPPPPPTTTTAWLCMTAEAIGGRAIHKRNVIVSLGVRRIISV